MFDGEVVLITGVGGGQGRAVASAFARAGAVVAGCDLHADGARETRELAQAEGHALDVAAPVDLGDDASVRAWIDGVAARLGSVDVLYNNASSPRFAPVAEMADADWHWTVRNELDLVFYACRAVWPHLTRRGGGAIVNVASIQGITAVRHAPGGFAHAATKHGVIGMTRELAREGGPYGIRVNAISPGLIITPATAAIERDGATAQRFLDQQMIKRLGRPEDVVGAALFLASSAAGFVTGANLVVDGGYTA